MFIISLRAIAYKVMIMAMVLNKPSRGRKVTKSSVWLNDPWATAAPPAFLLYICIKKTFPVKMPLILPLKTTQFSALKPSLTVFCS